MLKLYHLPLILLALIGAVASNPARGDEAKLRRDAYNHLTVSFALLRHGIDAADLRSEILSNVDLSGLPSDVQAHYRGLLSLTDKVRAAEQDAERRQAEHDELVRRQREQQDKAFMKTLVGAGVTTLVGGGLGTGSLLSLLFSAPSEGDPAKAARQVAVLQTDQTLIEEISTYEFELSLLRSKLAKAHGFASAELVTPQDVDRYVNLTNRQLSHDDHAGELQRLVLDAPSLYIAAYELGTSYLSAGRLEQARRSFQRAAAAVPSVVMHSKLRGSTNALLAATLYQEGGSLSTAHPYAERALKDDPSNGIALFVHGLALADAGALLDAKQTFERLLALHPQHVQANAIYTLMLAETGAAPAEVVAQLGKAFDHGFTDVRIAQKLKEVASLRTNPELDELLRMKLEWVGYFQLLAPVRLGLINNSRYGLTNIRIKVLFRKWENGRASDWYYDPRSQETLVANIKPGERYELDAFSGTLRDTAQVQLELESDQGGRRVTFNTNSNGFVVAQEHEL
jgi:tetratricopeptide (TPR) repeat protein